MVASSHPFPTFRAHAAVRVDVRKGTAGELELGGYFQLLAQDGCAKRVALDPVLIYQNLA